MALLMSAVRALALICVLVCLVNLSEAKRKRVKETEAGPSTVATAGALKFSYLVTKDSHEKNGAEENESLEAWRAPVHIQQEFPYYFTGYDTKDRPVWIVPYGKYNIPKVTEEGGENLKALEKWLAQFALRVKNSRDVRSKPGRTITETIYLLDFDGVDAEKFAHLPSFLMSMSPLESNDQRPESSFNNGVTVIINANTEVSRLLSLTRSAFGREMERVEVYGTDKSEWLPKLQKHFPRYVLPPQYGGRKDFRPVASYGK